MENRPRPWRITALTSGSGQGCSALALRAATALPSEYPAGSGHRWNFCRTIQPLASPPTYGAMMTLIGRRPWAFAALYMVVSLLVEIVLIVVVGWKVPTDNAADCAGSLDAPTLAGRGVLRLSPAAQGFPDGTPLRGALLTLLITVVLNRLSGVTTGLAEPILNRSVAAWLAGAMTNQVRRNAFETGS